MCLTFELCLTMSSLGQIVVVGVLYLEYCVQCIVPDKQ